MDLINMLPGGNIAFTLVAFVVALSIIVTVHEYGHYIVGRWCGIHAEVFSLGFGKVLFSHVDRHGTRWQLAALPFGGYVKFLGDADAASGKDENFMETVDETARERTMHGAKLWRRSATVAAGPIFNFILSILVFAGIFFFQGQATETPIIERVKNLPVTTSGIQSGDRIVAVEGVEVADYAALYEALDAAEPSETMTYTVERGGDTLQVVGPFGFPPLIDRLQPQSAAMSAGLKAGDVIVAIDGTPIQAFSEVRTAATGSEGAEMALRVWRDGDFVETTLAPKRTDLPAADGGFETRWLIGIIGGLFFEPQTEAVGPLNAIWGGMVQTSRVIESSLSGIYHMVIGEISACNLQGPIGIAEISGQAASQGTQSFIWLIAVLSTAVGLLNLFPIPILDGGHLVFHAYEAVTKRPPSDWALRVMMSLGLTLILGFMLFSVTNDLFCP